MCVCVCRVMGICITFAYPKLLHIHIDLSVLPFSPHLCIVYSNSGLHVMVNYLTALLTILLCFVACHTLLAVVVYYLPS